MTDHLSVGRTEKETECTSCSECGEAKGSPAVRRGEQPWKPSEGSASGGDVEGASQEGLRPGLGGVNLVAEYQEHPVCSPLEL